MNSLNIKNFPDQIPLYQAKTFLEIKLGRNSLMLEEVFSLFQIYEIGVHCKNEFYGTKVSDTTKLVNTRRITYSKQECDELTRDTLLDAMSKNFINGYHNGRKINGIHELLKLTPVDSDSFWFEEIKCCGHRYILIDKNTLQKRKEKIQIQDAYVLKEKFQRIFQQYKKKQPTLLEVRIARFKEYLNTIVKTEIKSDEDYQKWYDELDDKDKPTKDSLKKQLKNFDSRKFNFADYDTFFKKQKYIKFKSKLSIQ